MTEDIFFELLNVPTYCNLLWSDQQAARNCPKGDIKLVFHSDTGLITNVVFDPNQLRYDQDYENSLHYSPRFQKYAQTLAANLVKRHHLYNKQIIEIGCGKGDFLVSLCQLGHNQGIGFDPSYVSRPEHESMADQIQFIQDYYSEVYTHYPADFICCRHTLEHIIHPGNLLRPLRQTIGDRLNTQIFFEVPNALHTFRHLAVWDIIYEHCCYFVAPSLAYAFTQNGFQVQKVDEVFNGQFLYIEAQPVADPTPLTNEHRRAIAPIKRDLANFTTGFEAKIHVWKETVSQMVTQGQRVVIWGAGSKGVTFLNVLQYPSLIDYVVDINPRKQDKYIAGTGQQIVSPEFLRDYQPDGVIVMNSIYKNEIRQMTTALGLSPEFICA